MSSLPYPLQLQAFDAGLSLLIPNPDKVRDTYQQLREIEASSPFPYWAKVWDASLALSKFLATHPELVKGKNVLELGAGIGLPSFTIAGWASSLMITDGNPDAVELLQENIASLELKNASASMLDWNAFPDDLNPDLVLMSDVNYEPDQFNPLMLLIRKLLEKKIPIIIATPQRMSAVAFVENLEPFIKGTFVQTVGEADATTNISIYLLSNA